MLAGWKSVSETKSRRCSSMFSHKQEGRKNAKKSSLALAKRNNQSYCTGFLSSSTIGPEIIFFFCPVLIRFRSRNMSRQMNNHREEDSTELEPERILVHKLVDSSKAQRTKAVERLKAWINARTLNATSFFAYDDLIKIWKGLYYNMWMADKPVLQVIRPIYRSRSHSIFTSKSSLGSTSIASILLGSWISWWWSGTFVHRCGFRYFCSRMVGNRSMASEQVHDGNRLERTSFLTAVLFLSSSSFVTFYENRLSSWKNISGSKRISKNSRKCLLRIF